MKWLRFYSDALNDPKVQRLKPTTFKAWINLLCLANIQEQRGVLPPISDIAYALRITDRQASGLIEDLRSVGLLDVTANGVRPHKWDKWQPESDDAAARVRNKRRTRSEQPPNMFAPDQNRTEQNRTEGDPDQDPEAEEEAEQIAWLRRRVLESGLPWSEEVERQVRAALCWSSTDCVVHGLEEAVRYNRLSWAYVESVMRRHAEEGCDTPGQTRAERLVERTRRRGA